MPFWDRFVLWVYLGLADTLPLGRDALGRIFDQACTLGRLNPVALNDLSILLLVAGGRPGSLVRQDAFLEMSRRGLDRSQNIAYVRALLDAIRPPRLTEMLEINRPHQPASAQLLCNVLTSDSPSYHRIWSDLHEFVARLRLISPFTVALNSELVRVFYEAFQHYLRNPQGTYDFLSILYHHVLGYQVNVWPVPDVTSLDSANWIDSIPEADEQTFVRRCISPRFPPNYRRLLLLHFLGRLSPEQIAGALRWTDPSWTADLVVKKIEKGWMAILW